LNVGYKEAFLLNVNGIITAGIFCK